MKFSRDSSRQRSLLYADIQALHECRLIDIGSNVVKEQIGKGGKLRDTCFLGSARLAPSARLVSRA